MSMNPKENAVKIQKWFRGCMLRLKRLPTTIYAIQEYLKSLQFQFSKKNDDGRINSCLDEDEVIRVLLSKFGKRIKIPKIRMWYDMLAYDYMYGWLVINIKSTTMMTSDNTGNLAMCVYAYTDEYLDIHRDRTYENGIMSKILIDRLKNRRYNFSNKKDYYFIVLNKTSNDVIANSVKGLSVLTPNANNLPFQVCWNKNRHFCHERIEAKIRQFMECVKKPKPSWKETFLAEIRDLRLE